MVKIFNEVVKKQDNFWNGCLFHPTDAIEDDWGKRILDQIAEDKACHTVRIYTMFEDIVSVDENGKLQFDFTLSDIRMDYLVEKGFNLLLAYAGMPDCIARDCSCKSSAAKNKTRYKGKMWNTSPPKNPELWEEVCYQYTKHIVERYGEEVVSSWYCQCFNEPDCQIFFMPNEEVDSMQRVEEYFAMYEGFVRGVRRAGTKMPVGGPTLAESLFFLENFLKLIKERGTEINYLTLHFYGTAPAYLNTGDHGLSAWGNLDHQRPKIDLIKKYGFENIPIIADEWGASSMGFFNKEECKFLMFRETEINAAYYVRFVYFLIRSGLNIKKLLICLSGQHEMTEDFSGFRNFFTLNFIKKPIYNAYILASKLGNNLLRCSADVLTAYPMQGDEVTVIPTKRDDGSLAVLLCYGEGNFLLQAPDKEETIEFEEDICGKTVTIWCIDKEHTNPYRLAQKNGWGKDLTQEQIEILREEGNLKPVYVGKATGKIDLKLTAGATFLITIE